MFRRILALPVVAAAAAVVVFPAAAQAKRPHYLITVKAPSVAHTATVLPTTSPGQGLINNEACGVYVGFATGGNPVTLTGGNPADAVTTNETQIFGSTTENVGTLTTTVCTGVIPSTPPPTLPTSAQVASGLCAQFQPFAPSGTLIQGDAVTTVYPDGSYSAVCRTVIPSNPLQSGV